MGEAKRRRLLERQTVAGDNITVSIRSYENDLPGFDTGLMLASEARQAGKPFIGTPDRDVSISCPKCGLTIVAEADGPHVSFKYPETSTCTVPGDHAPEALKCPAFSEHYFEALEEVIANLSDRRRRRGR